MSYTVKEIAQRTGLTEHAVRYYTDQGLLPCRRDANNRRVFDEESVNWLAGIKCLKGCGMSIADIREYVELCMEGDTERSLQGRCAIVRSQLGLARQRAREAAEVAAYIERKVRHYEDILAHKIPDDTNPATWREGDSGCLDACAESADGAAGDGLSAARP